MGPTDEAVLDWFTSYAADPFLINKVQKAYRDTARVVLDYVPASADRTTALRRLHEASMLAVFAFTHNQEH